MRTSKTLRLIVCAVFIVAILGLFNAALTYVLVPYGSDSQIAWTELDEQESVDTLYTGTSISERSFGPYALDEHFGTRSFNLSTPDQTLEESLIGIQSAYERFGIKRVVMALQFTCLQEGLSNKPGDAFMSNRARFVSRRIRLPPISDCLQVRVLQRKPHRSTWRFPGFSTM